MRITVSDYKGEAIGEIWSDGESTIKARPDGIITLTRQFLDANPDTDAAGIVAMMDGYSNGYIVCRAVA